MNITIREEQANDHSAVHTLITSAFACVAESDHREQQLVERLRKSDAFVPQLSLVAEDENGRIVGYILLTRLYIVSEKGRIPSLAVAPLAVLPDFQYQGIGGQLIRFAHQRAAQLGFKTAVLLGHKDYYPRFGYRKAIDYGIYFPFDAPHDCCMVVELQPHALEGTTGTIHYPDAFFL